MDSYSRTFHPNYFGIALLLVIAVLIVWASIAAFRRYRRRVS